MSDDEDSPVFMHLSLLLHFAHGDGILPLCFQRPCPTSMGSILKR
jgi:hypothetical protein